MNKSRINKIANLMQISKTAQIDPLLQGWLDFYRRTFELEECEKKRQIDSLTKEQAISFHGILIDLERSGAQIPSEYKKDVISKALGYSVECPGEWVERVTIPFDVIGSFDALGPIATAADLTSAALQSMVGERFRALISLISTIPTADLVTKPLIILLRAIKLYSQGNAAVEVAGIFFKREDIERTAKFVYANLKRNEDKFLPILPEDMKVTYDDMIDVIEDWA